MSEIQEQEFTVSAVLNSNGYLDSFGIHPKTARIFGVEPEDIIDVRFKIADDQAPNPNRKDVDYWGWYSFKKKDFSGRLIWHRRELLQMCFPYGIKAEEKANKGKAYRLTIISP